MNSYSKITPLTIRIVVLLGLIGFFLSSALFAQNIDYEPQVEAFKTSFDRKSVEPVKKHLSEELAFFTYPASATLPILNQVFSNLPKLNTIEITESKPGEVTVRYKFAALGERNSKIRFDEAGKIIKIELIDNLLEEQQKAQQAMTNSVQEPSPGSLGKKYAPQKVTFESKDGLMVSGNLYEAGPGKPVVLLCHQANYNKYEYADIAPKLNASGFNVLAIDQRSGGTFAGQPNETFLRAREQNFSTEFLDAEQDIEAAVDFLSERYGKPITLWGSSYSASLVLYMAASNDAVNGVIGFSPGDYFGESKPKLNSVLKESDIPFLITSSKEEAKRIQALLNGVDLKSDRMHFVPESNGFHGSRALWEGQKGAGEYWQTVNRFLEELYPGHN